MYSLFALACLSFLLSLLLTPLVRSLCTRFGLVDEPGGRKIHQHAVPRAGGIAVVLAYVLAVAFLILSGTQGGNVIWQSRAEIARLLPAALSIFVIGLVDDLRGLKPSSKIIGQIGAALLAFSAGVHVNGISGYPFPNWASLPLTIAWLLICTNAVNLIDGIDGLATGVGLFATITMVLAALMQDNVALAFAVVPLAGALLGFLRYNFNPATIFLGDSGSLFIGFMLGCYGILWSEKSATMLGMTAPLMALAIPLLDTSLAIFRRFLHNKPIFTADRGHIHHRLLDRGFTPRKVALLLYGCCALGAICSLLMMSSHANGVVLIVFAAGTWIGVQHLGYVEFGVAGRMFLEGAFRRQLTSQVAISNFQANLAAAESPSDCWTIIEAASRHFGFHSVRLCLAGQTFASRDSVDLGRCWVLRVPLSASEYVELSRELGNKEHCPVVTPFVDTVYQALAPKLARFSGEAIVPSTQPAATGRQHVGSAKPGVTDVCAPVAG